MLSLLFARAARPNAAAIDAVARDALHAECGFIVTHQPPKGDGWLGLLAGGLAFDLVGLAPATPIHIAPGRHAFGLDGPELPADLEAVELRPGPHLAGGPALLQVVKALTGIAAALSRLDGVRAICWHPAGSRIEPRLFARLIAIWFSGGVFPSHCLTPFARGPDGSLRSDGLAFFIGQELELEAGSGETPAETARLAGRLAQRLIEDGPVHSPDELIGPGGEQLDADPSRDGRTVRIWRRR